MSKAPDERSLQAQRFRKMADETTDPMAMRLIGDIADEMEAKARMEPTASGGSTSDSRTPSNDQKKDYQKDWPPSEESLGGGDICSVEWEPSTQDDEPLN